MKNLNPTQLFRDIFSSFRSALSRSFQMMMAGFPGQLPIAGATGFHTREKHIDQRTSCKSMRQMRTDWGHNIDNIGARRFIRNLMRYDKRKNSYCNNLNNQGIVICN